MKNWRNTLYFLSIIFLLLTPEVYAMTTGNLPFVSSAEKIKENVSAWIFIAATVLAMVTFLMAAFGDWDQGFQKILRFGFFVSLALAVPTAMSYLFGAGATF